MTIYRDTDKQAIEPILKTWSDKYNLTCIEIKEVEKSARLYFALLEIVKKYELSAVTIKCFDLVTFQSYRLFSFSRTK